MRAVLYSLSRPKEYREPLVTGVHPKLLVLVTDALWFPLKDIHGHVTTFRNKILCFQLGQNAYHGVGQNAHVGVLPQAGGRFAPFDYHK